MCVYIYYTCTHTHKCIRTCVAMHILNVYSPLNLSLCLLSTIAWSCLRPYAEGCFNAETLSGSPVRVIPRDDSLE